MQVVQELRLTREVGWERDWPYAPINEILVGWGWEEVTARGRDLMPGMILGFD